MNSALLKELLVVPTISYKEQLMVDWLVWHVRKNIKGAHVTVDNAGNVYVVKGTAKYSPCVAAHTDTVQPLRIIQINQNGNRLTGENTAGVQAGIGADDKAGIFVCLELLQRTENIRAVFFATEEVGCVGARKADPKFFEEVGCVIEYDCPGVDIMSYTCGGVRLFANRGEFIQKTLDVLPHHEWQNHPYTDVMTVRERFDVSCLNLACGYHNWHMSNEYIHLPSTELAIERGAKLIQTLGNARYACARHIYEEEENWVPLRTVRPLRIPEPQSC